MAFSWRCVCDGDMVVNLIVVPNVYSQSSCGNSIMATGEGGVALFFSLSTPISYFIRKMTGIWCLMMIK